MGRRWTTFTDSLILVVTAANQDGTLGAHSLSLFLPVGEKVG
jgi:hypothetical protein